MGRGRDAGVDRSGRRRLRIDGALILLAAALLALQAPAPPPPVADWSALPVFPLPRTAIAADASLFVRREVEAGRCVAPAGERSLDAPVAVLVGPSGIVRQIVPRAIGCPTVEQYTVGYLLALTRGGPGSVMPPQPGWYTLVVGYRW